jgi:serine/threonine protein kinase
MAASPTLVAGRYRLVEQLGAGGMGRVWHARDESLGRDVAVKEIVPPDELLAAERDELRRRTLREARAAARLSHPNVVRVYDVFETEGRSWIVMEYVPSRSLQEVLAADGPLDPVRAATIGLGLLRALRAAHRAGVLHRDIKPSNVLLCADGRVVLTDFGIATVEGDAKLTRSGLVVGSPAYIAPERARENTAGPASDLWSLGATLYAAVEGRSPYERPSMLATLAALASEEPDPARNAGPLRPVLDGLLRKDPAARMTAPEAERLLRRAATPSAPSTLRFRWPWSGSTATAASNVDAEPDTEPATAAPGPPQFRSGSAQVQTATPTSELDAQRARRRSLIVVVALAAVAVFGASWVILSDPWSPGPEPNAGSTPSQAASPQPSPEPAPSTAPPNQSGPAGDQPAQGGAPARPALPDGWRLYTDDTGFSVYVPAHWQRSQEGTMVYFRGDGRVLGIDQRDDPQWDPVGDWTRQRDARLAAGDFPGYSELRLEEVDYGIVAADWEFTFDGRSGERQHVNNRGVVVSQSKAYGFWWQTPDADWEAARPDLDLIFRSFRPASDA